MRAIAGTAIAGLLVGLLPLTAAPAAQASTGGALTTNPINVTMHPVSADGTTSGQLDGRVDLPVLLGDHGSYVLNGLTTPDSDFSGNGANQISYPAGSIPGVLTDPEDGKIDDEPGEGVDIGASSDSIVRTPAGLVGITELNDVVLNVSKLNDKVGAVLGRDEILRADRIVTEATARVDGEPNVTTRVEGLKVLDSVVELVDGRLSQPVSRNAVVQSNDVVALLRSLGIDEEDIDQYAGLISSSSLDANFTVTVSTPATGGLSFSAHIDLRLKASAILGLGSADVRANQVVLEGSFGNATASKPNAIAPSRVNLTVEEIEAGETVTVTGLGFVQNGTTVKLAGTEAEITELAADGTSLTFRVPNGLVTSDYEVVIETVGGTVSAGDLRVIGEDFVALTVTGITPGSSNDGQNVTVAGTGFGVGETHVRITDAENVEHLVPASEVNVAATGLSLTFRLPEGLALGTANVSVEYGTQSGATSIEITALQLPAVPSTGGANVTGISSQSTQVPLTVDNSGVMSWTAPTVINPAGTADAATELTVGLPSLNSTGTGSTSGTGAGITGTVNRQLDALVASAQASGYGLSLPAPWDGFFARGNVVTADAINVTSRAQTNGTAQNSVSLNNLRVLGNPVTLVDGKLQQAQEFRIALDSNTLKSRKAMNGVFWSAEGGGYDRQKGETVAELWVRVEPVAETAANGNASAGAFRVVADLRYRYNGENGGWLSTRARHGSGTSRDGVRVNFFAATVGATSVQSPQAIAADVTSVSPRFVDAGDSVTVSGRGFAADSVVRFGDRDVTPTSISADGTSLVFAVPSDATGSSIVAVRTSAGTSATTRQVVIKEAPAVTEQPQSITVTNGHRAEFTASASGSPLPTARWERQAGDEWVATGVTGNTLNFVATPADNGANFRAVFTSPAGEVITDSATLTVEYAPLITQQPTVSTLFAGQPATFQVGVDAHPAAETVWQINRGAGWQQIGTGTELTFTPTSADNGATLRARAGNAAGVTTSDELALAVMFAPEVTLQPADTSVLVDETATFTAAANGNPEPAVRWEVSSGLGGEWLPVDQAIYPTATTGTLEIPATIDFNGLHFRAVFTNGFGGDVATQSAKLSVSSEPTEPGNGIYAVLGSPLSVGANAIMAYGQATGGALSGLINAELSKGAEIGESGRFQLPESGTPYEYGVIENDHAAGIPGGNGIGDLASGVTYGDTNVKNTWDEEGITSAVTVDSFRIDHLALDNKARIGTLLGIDEIVNATGVTASAYAPSDNDFETSTTASIGSLSVLGQQLGAEDGFVNGRLQRPVERQLEIQIDDFASVMAQLGVDPSAYLTEELIGEASARVTVIVSQPRNTDANTAFATGLHVSAFAELELYAETQGGDRVLVESINLSTNERQQILDIDVAATAAARNGAELPEPDDGSGPVDPVEPGVQIPDLPLRDIEFYAPSTTPSRVIQTITGDAATSRTITWRTDDTVNSAVAEYRVVGQENVVTVPATSRDALDRSGSQGSNTLAYRAATHVADLTGLAPETSYSYRVGDGQNWSEWFEFRTAASAAKPFTFIYTGDAQNDLRAQWEEGIQAAYTKVPDAELVLHAGDLINHADNDVQWGEWFASAPQQNATIPQVTVTGNHEFLNGALYNSWQEHFTNPLNGPQADSSVGACEMIYQEKIANSLKGAVYYIDYQGVRFVTLSGTPALADFLPDSNLLVEAGCSESVDVVTLWLDMQAKFLDKALEENPGDWSVVSVHQPLFSTSEGRGNPHLRDAFLDILEKHNVDLVLQGHDHTYGRGHLTANEVATQPGASTGPVYVVSVLGPKFYELNPNTPNDWAANGATQVTAYQYVRTFQEIKIDGGRLSYTAHEYGTGKVADSFEICKNPAGEKIVVESADQLPADCAELPAREAALQSLTPAVSGDQGTNDWFVSAATVELQGAADVAAGLTVQYRIGETAEWAAYTAPVAVPANGTHLFEYRVIDAEQASSTRSQEVKVDTALPALNDSLSERTLRIAASDVTSGVERVEYRVDGGEWTVYTAPVVFDAHAHAVEYRAFDRAGNVTVTVPVAVPNTVPERAVLTTLVGDREVLEGAELQGLAARLADESGAPVSNKTVQFSLIGGATFAGGATTADVATNAAGIAVAPKVTAAVAGATQLVVSYGEGGQAVSAVVSNITVTAAATELAADIDLAFSNVGGRVVLSATVQNTNTVPVEIEVKTRYGKQTFSGVEANGVVSHAFNSRLTAIPAGVVEVTVTDSNGNHNLITESYALARAATLG